MFCLGVFAIISDSQQRILLCHRRDSDLWNPPGGRLEAGEAPWQGVIREVKEETGLDVRVERLAGVYSKPQANEVVFSFICTVIGGLPTVTEEGDRVAFFAVESLPPNTSPKQVERVHDALDHPDQVVTKVQRGRPYIELVGKGKR